MEDHWEQLCLEKRFGLDFEVFRFEFLPGIKSRKRDLKDDRSDEEEEDSLTDNEECTKNGSKNGCAIGTG
ncbi:hypothetical protein UY3_01076 [Chelonia mydas]|uniref:Uncharacterized protein n=1 Tax=Chelonia mydas TaxID=8469 RepID=M7BV20_CHEMY|nr:hypothetical protein UY3_01076 [Chelonia mydas]